MNDAYRTETVDSDAGTYTIQLFPDYDAENPLTEWDHDGMAFFVYQPGSGHQPIIDTLADAGRAGEALAALIDLSPVDYLAVVYRFAKWKAITGSAWTLVDGSGSTSTQGDWWNWYVLADEGWTDPARAAKDTMATYERWALRGGFTGYVVESPNGGHVDSCWGFADEYFALAQARESVAVHARDRVIAANLAGSGFVGVL